MLLACQSVSMSFFHAFTSFYKRIQNPRAAYGLSAVHILGIDDSASAVICAGENKGIPERKTMLNANVDGPLNLRNRHLSYGKLLGKHSHKSFCIAFGAKAFFSYDIEKFLQTLG